MLDEAHERSLNTDVLFALTSRLLRALSDAETADAADARGSAAGGRGALRVVIASATLDAARFSAYFNGAPIVHAGGTPFNVQIFHLAKSLPSDAARLEAALELAMRVHTERPAGPDEDILLFLTGQEEIATAVHAARAISADLGSSAGMPALRVLPLHASLPAAEQARHVAAPGSLRHEVAPC